MKQFKRFDVWLVELDPTVGGEMGKKRPAVIVSPNSLNKHLKTVIVVPLTTGRVYPFRVKTKSGGKDGSAAIDQIRTLDKRRLKKRLSSLRGKAATDILDALSELFAD